MIYHRQAVTASVRSIFEIMALEIPVAAGGAKGAFIPGVLCRGVVFRATFQKFTKQDNTYWLQEF